MLKGGFVRPAGLDSPRALLNAVADTPGDEWSVEVLLETDVEDASWQLPSVGFALEQTEGGTLLRCSTSDLGWMARVLAGLECPFVVRRPAELRYALQRRAEEISALAKRVRGES
jgi:hypothetical protein